MAKLNKTFLIGGDLAVNRIGYGAMRLTGQPANFGPYPNWQQGIDLLKEASKLGVNFFDSAHSYGPEWADKIIGDAFADHTSKPVLATKGGITKLAVDRMQVGGDAARLNLEIDLALKNLQVNQIDLFQLHRVDPNVDIEVSIEALAKAQQAGKIRHIGVSNVTRKQLDRALTVAPIASVQNRFNQAETGASELVDYTRDLGIAFIPYGPLGAHPMQRGAKLPAREAIAWLLRRSPNIIVIPGTTSIAHLRDNVSAWELVGKQ